jgi:hypothetical protein
VPICKTVAASAAALIIVSGIAGAEDGKTGAAQKVIADHGRSLNEAVENYRTIFVEAKAETKTKDGLSATTRRLPRLQSKDLGDNAMLLIEFRCSGRLYGLKIYETLSNPRKNTPLIQVVQGFIAGASEIPDMRAQWTLYRRSVGIEYPAALNGVVASEFLFKIQRKTLGLAYGQGKEDPRFLRDSRQFVAFPSVRETYFIPTPHGDQADREIEKAKANDTQKKIIALFERYHVYGTTVFDVAVCAADGKHEPKAVRGFVIDHQTKTAVTGHLAGLAAMKLAGAAKK